MNNTHFKVSMHDINCWFLKNGFTRMVFENDVAYVFASNRLPNSIVHKLQSRANFDTYWREAYGGAVLVFEVSLLDGKLVYDCYSPIWLFGVWLKRLKFKDKAGLLTRYLKEGFHCQARFLRFLENTAARNRD